MRILVLTERYPPHHTGGDETACYAVVEGLQRRGHQVRVLVSQYGTGTPRVEGNVFRVLHRPEDTPSLPRQAWWELQDHRSFRRHVREFQPDVLASWCIFGLFPSMHRALRRTGLPVVYNMQNLWLDRQLRYAADLHAAWHRPGSSPLRGLVKAVTRRAVTFWDRTCLRLLGPDEIDLRHLVQCSRASEDAHRDAGFEGVEWPVIYNGVDLDRFSRSAERFTEAFRILFAGRLVKEKGLHTAIEAVAELNGRGVTPVQLDVAGPAGYPASYVQGLHQAVRDQGLHDQVRFLGPMPYDDIPGLFAKYHALVFPSLIPEGFPMTLIEAMACGLPVIGTPTGGSAEILEHGVTGLTFGPGNAGQLADRLGILIRDEALRRRIGEAGRRWVQQHCDLRTVVARWEEFLERIRTPAGPQTIATKPGVMAALR